MFTKLTAVIFLILASICLDYSQTSSVIPKPGPEHQKLAALVGNWTTSGETISSPFGPEEKMSGKIDSRWFSGQFAVVRNNEGKSNIFGNVTAMDVIAYDADAKSYTWYRLDSTGGTGMGKVEITGDTLISMWDANANGKPYKLRGTLKGLGSDKLNFVMEYSEDGKQWKAFFHSSDTRTKQ